MKRRPGNPSRNSQTAFYRLAPRGGNLGELADLWIASWQAAMPGIDFASRRQWFLGYLNDLETRGATTICALAGGHPAGFILLDPSRGVLEQIAVLPQLFGAGVGALLLGEAKRLCPAGLVLEVNADNVRAVRFYEKGGFVVEAAGANPLSDLKTWKMRWKVAGDG